MRCEEVREVIEELRTAKAPAESLEHLASCSACSEYARGWRLVRAGFVARAEEESPEPTLGFAARLTRRWEEASENRRSGAEFLERIGRRFVFAASALTLTAMLGLALPCWGPLQGLTTPEVLGGQPEVATLGNDPVFTEGSESPENVHVTPASGGEKTEP